MSTPAMSSSPTGMPSPSCPPLPISLVYANPPRPSTNIHKSSHRPQTRWPSLRCRQGTLPLPTPHSLSLHLASPLFLPPLFLPSPRSLIPTSPPTPLPRPTHTKPHPHHSHAASVKTKKPRATNACCSLQGHSLRGGNVWAWWIGIGVVCGGLGLLSEVL